MESKTRTKTRTVCRKNTHSGEKRGIDNARKRLTLAERYALKNSRENTLRFRDVDSIYEAWRGYKAGDFAERLLKAFDETEPLEIYQRIFLTLSSFLRGERDAITAQISQFSRRGLIIVPAHPVKDSPYRQGTAAGSLKWYSGGGDLLIPVDKESEEQLKKIGYKVVDPDLMPIAWRAGEDVFLPAQSSEGILSGIPRNSREPVWKQDYSLIPRLELFQSYVENPVKAPVFIERRIPFISEPH